MLDQKIKNISILQQTKFRGVCIRITLVIRPSVKVTLILFLTCMWVQPVTSVCYDIGILYLAHGFIIMRCCVYPCVIPIRRWPWPQCKILGFFTWLCLGPQFFSLWHSQTTYGRWVYYYGTMCHIHSSPCVTLTIDLNIKNIFLPWFWDLANSYLPFDISNLAHGCKNIRQLGQTVHSWPLYDLELWPLCWY